MPYCFSSLFCNPQPCLVLPKNWACASAREKGVREGGSRVRCWIPSVQAQGRCLGGWAVHLHSVTWPKAKTSKTLESTCWVVAIRISWWRWLMMDPWYHLCDCVVGSVYLVCPKVVSSVWKNAVAGCPSSPTTRPVAQRAWLALLPTWDHFCWQSSFEVAVTSWHCCYMKQLRSHMVSVLELRTLEWVRKNNCYI